METKNDILALPAAGNSAKKVCIHCGKKEKSRGLCTGHLTSFNRMIKAKAKKTGRDIEELERAAIAVGAILPITKPGGRPRKNAKKKPDPMADLLDSVW